MVRSEPTTEALENQILDVIAKHYSQAIFGEVANQELAQSLVTKVMEKFTTGAIHVERLRSRESLEEVLKIEVKIPCSQ